MILHVSDWKTIVVWRTTSRTMFKTVALFLRRRYEAYVRPYARDINLFDRLIRTHGAIISGPVALHFFLPGSFRIPHHIDLYLPADAFKPFVRLLSKRGGLDWRYVPRRKAAGTPTQPYDNMDDCLEGERILFDEQARPRKSAAEPEHGNSTSPDSHPRYGFTDESSDDDDRDLTTAEEDRTELFRELEHYDPNQPSIAWGKGFRAMRMYRTPSGRRVNVICSRSRSPVSPLRFFWSSIMMNFITPDSCVCGFPSATLARAGTLKLEPPRDQNRAVRTRYEEHGFSFHESLRRTLDVWDYVFFGEQRLLAIKFHGDIAATPTSMPIRQTSRGWLTDVDWRSIPHANPVTAGPDEIQLQAL